MQFVQPDTLIPEPYNPQSYNRYSYTQNNPIRYTDPTGHAAYSESEAGCSGQGPKCIMDMYGAYGDDDGMMDSLRAFVRRNKDYDPVADLELSDEEKALVSIAMFQAAVQDVPEGASWEEILKAIGSSAASLTIFGIINEGINFSPDDNGGGGALSGPKWTSKMLSESEVIAQGYNIRDVARLAQTYGGNPKGWKKMKGWDENGQEWHWYYHPDIGRVEVKPK